MDEQLALLRSALAHQVPPGATAPVDVSVSRSYGESTVTLRTQIGGAVPQAMPPQSVPRQMAPPMQMAPASGGAPVSLASVGQLEPEKPASIARAYTRNSFYEDEDQVPTLLAEIERLKRKALSRGVNLTSPQEDVPAEDVATLRQIFAIADENGVGEINRDQLGELHVVLGEPLTDQELASAFKAMDANRSNTISFEDFLAWYTLAHSSSGMLSKKGTTYTNRFQKIMNKLQSSFDIKHLTTVTTGEPMSLDYRVQFHYNDSGQLKQISPWHDIPLFSPDGHVSREREILLRFASICRSFFL